MADAPEPTHAPPDGTAIRRFLSAVHQALDLPAPARLRDRLAYLTLFERRARLACTSIGRLIADLGSDALERRLWATKTLERAFYEADNLAVLSRMWTDLSGGEYGRRYRGMLTRLLGAEQAAKVSTDARHTWLCRTLRAAELAGMDGTAVLTEAVHAGGLADADSIARMSLPIRRGCGRRRRT